MIYYTRIVSSLNSKLQHGHCEIISGNRRLSANLLGKSEKEKNKKGHFPCNLVLLSLPLCRATSDTPCTLYTLVCCEHYIHSSRCYQYIYVQVALNKPVRARSARKTTPVMQLAQIKRFEVLYPNSRTSLEDQFPLNKTSSRSDWCYRSEQFLTLCIA